MTVSSECDKAIRVIVCKPYVPSVNYGNSNLEMCLYREPINISRLLSQHNTLIRVLSDHGIDILHSTVNSYSNIALEYLANTVFTRDSVITTPKGIVVGNFREKIRVLEKKVSNMTYPNVVDEISQSTGYVEGGDFYVINKNLCMIACGNRTNWEGIQQLIKKKVLGTNRLAIVNYPEDGLLETMHLDCYLGIAGRNNVLLWENARELLVDEWDLGSESEIIARSGVPFHQYLQETGFNVHIVPTSAQKKYACNILTLDPGTVLTQEEYSTEVINNIPGMKAIHIEFDEFHKMYGGIHCATQVIHRCPSAGV